MKPFVIATLGLLVFSLPALAQRSPTSNATSLGDATTSGNSAGMPSASTPAGQITTTGTGRATPRAVPARRVRGRVQAAPTADSTVTGTTTR